MRDYGGHLVKRRGWGMEWVNGSLTGETWESDVNILFIFGKGHDKQ